LLGGDETRTKTMVAISSLFTAVSVAIFTFFAGFLSDHMKTKFGRRKPFLLLGTVGTVCSFVLRYNLFTGKSALGLLLNIVLLCVQDGAQALAVVGFLALILDVFQNVHYGFISVLYAVVHLIGAVLGAMLFGSFLDTTQHPTWLVVGLCSFVVVITIGMLFVQREPDRNYANQLQFSYVVSDDDTVVDEEAIVEDDLPVPSHQSSTISSFVQSVPVMVFEYFKPLQSRHFLLLVSSLACFSLAVHMFKHMSLFYIRAKFVSSLEEAQNEYISYWSMVYLSGIIGSLIPLSLILLRRGEKILICLSGAAFVICCIIVGVAKKYMLVWLTAFIVGPAIVSVYSIILAIVLSISDEYKYHATGVSLFYLAHMGVQELANPLGASLVFPIPRAGYFLLFFFCGLFSVLSAVQFLLMRVPESYSSTNVMLAMKSNENGNLGLYGDEQEEIPQQDEESYQQATITTEEEVPDR